MADYKKIMFNNTHMTETIDDVESTQVNSQVDKFSTDYTADKLNELYNEFDSITLTTVQSIPSPNVMLKA